jgi:DNA-binding beta-propeller fold protein YncE
LQNLRSKNGDYLTRALAALLILSGVGVHGLLLEAAARRATDPRVEIALVANAEAAQVALVEIHAWVGVIDVNPAKTRAEGPGTPNFAQDTDVSPDGRTLYVSRGYLGDVAAFDIATGRLLWQRSLNTGRADHMTLTPDGRSLFVSAMMDNRVYKITTATGEIAGHLVTGVYPHDVKVSQYGRQLFTSSLGPLRALPRSPGSMPLTETPAYPIQLTVADVDTLTVRDRIPLDSAFRPWQFSPDERRAYAQLSNQHAIVGYDMATAGHCVSPVGPRTTPRWSMPGTCR